MYLYQLSNHTNCAVGTILDLKDPRTDLFYNSLQINYISRRYDELTTWVHLYDDIICNNTTILFQNIFTIHWDKHFLPIKILQINYKICHKQFKTTSDFHNNFWEYLETIEYKTTIESFKTVFGYT